MAKEKKPKLDTWAPVFGHWTETANQPPPAAVTFLGMWHIKGHRQLEDACCFYYDADGKKVDPEEKPHTSIRYWRRHGSDLVQVPQPDLWCEARFVIPVGLAWEKAHGLG
jgi:hypothetical protein